MTWIPAKMPRVVKKIFPNYVWDFFSEVNSSHKKTLYLTFDDGPQPDITEFVLSALAQYNAKATFFCIGDNVRKYPEIFKQVLEQGHAIGNHTQHHLEGWKTSTKDYISDTLEAQKVIDSKIHDTMPKVSLFRPPYGRIKNSQGKALKALGYKIIMWDVVAKDWMDSISEEQCLKNMINNAANGSIIVMHDSQKASKNVRYGLPKLLEYFSNQGYQFKTIEI